MSKNGINGGIKTVIIWTIGIASLALILLIVAIIFGNLSGNVGFGSDTTTFGPYLINWSLGPVTIGNVSNKQNVVLSGITVINSSSGTTVTANNYTILGQTIVNATAVWGLELVNVSGTATYDSEGLKNTNNIINNYTSSAVNTASQFPTVGTILGVVVLLILLVTVLIYVFRKLTGMASGNNNISTRGSKGSIDYGGFA